MHAFTEVAVAGLTGRRPPSPTTVLGDCWQWTEGDAMLVRGGEVGKRVRRSQKKWRILSCLEHVGYIVLWYQLEGG